MIQGFLASLAGGGGSQAAPVLDGPLRPNQRLDSCRMLDRFLDGADDVVVRTAGSPIVSAGNRLLEIGGHWYAPMRRTIATLAGRAGAMCVLADGSLAVAIDGNHVEIIAGPREGARIDAASGKKFRSITALAPLPDGGIVICEGSQSGELSHWRRDLLEGGTDGRLCASGPALDAVETVAAGLAWPAGVCAVPDGTFVVAEAWRHRLLRVPAEPGSPPEPVLENLPAYPGRLVPDGEGGYWLTCFALRTQLVEFVMRERRFLAEMMATVPEEYWIAPALRASDDPLEPLQMGGIKQMGVKKPWAPPRSYGLVVHLDSDFEPVASLHSRNDGKRHGITGVAVDSDGSAYFVSRGHGKLVLHREADE